MNISAGRVAGARARATRRPTAAVTASCASVSCTPTRRSVPPSKSPTPGDRFHRRHRRYPPVGRAAAATTHSNTNRNPQLPPTVLATFRNLWTNY